MYLQGFWDTLKVIKKVITVVESEYVIKKLGYEGYFYLLFLRRLVQIELGLVILDLTVSLPYILFFK